MLNAYPGKKLRNLRKRANLTQMQVVDLTGVSETTIHYLEHDLRRPQTHTLEKLLNLYAIRITRLEKMERIWGEDGLQKPGEPMASPNTQKTGRRESRLPVAQPVAVISESHKNKVLADPTKAAKSGVDYSDVYWKDQHGSLRRVL